MSEINEKSNGFNFKSGKFQVCLVGAFAFCGPGLFNALNGLGAAGSGDAKTSAAANGTLYAAFTFFGYFSGVIMNIIGPSLCFFLGGLTYAIYALCTYYTTPDRVWLAAIGGFQLGVGAGVFWCAQSALTMSYATEAEKATFTTIFWTIFNLGGVFGGFLQMGLNWKLFAVESGGIYSAAGSKASAAAYWTFIVLMCTGAVLSFFLLASPAKVRRSDGTRVIVEKQGTAKEEIIAACKGITDPFVVRMMLYFVFSNWFYTYEFGYLNGLMFNSRGQGMNSGLYWASQMGGSILFSMIVDKLGKRKNWSVKKACRVGFFLNIGFLVISWILAFVVQYTACDGRVDKNNTPDSVADFALDPSGNKLTTNLSKLAWFPPQGDVSGCDYLKAMRQKQMQENGYAECLADSTCVNNMYQCVPEGYYGRGLLDVVNDDKGYICNVVTPSECIQLPLKYTSQSLLIIITYIFMGFSDAIFQVYCYYLMAKMARGSLRDSARYAAAYKGIQSFGAAIAWGTDYLPEFLYRYQAYVCVVFGALSSIGSWITIPLVARASIEQDTHGLATKDGETSKEDISSSSDEDAV